MLNIGQIHRKEYDLEKDRSTPVVFAESPGRIHFLGGQGDPKSGIFLSAAVDRYIHLAVSPRKDKSFRFFAADIGERKRTTVVSLKFRREDRWANYLKPAIYLFIELGYPMKGLNFSFCGDIPQNIGLASSIAIETAAATALRGLLRVQINDEDFARKLKEAHEKIFGERAELADYLVCFLARKDQFLFFDSSKNDVSAIKTADASAIGDNKTPLPNVKLIKSPFANFRFILVDSRVPRIGAEREIASRQNDILKGLELLSQKNDGADFKDYASGDLLEVIGNFPEQIRRRCMHIVEEIRRVNDAADALERSDLASFAKIIYHSHESLRDLYEISCPEIDWFVKRAQEIEGAAGSRIDNISPQIRASVNPGQNEIRRSFHIERGSFGRNADFRNSSQKGGYNAIHGRA
ncbi:galactokinase [Treponema sp. R8-4-B8]